MGPLNGCQTPTMANFATLADLLSACVVQAKPDACRKLYAAPTGPDGKAPHDTLTAAESGCARPVVPAGAALSPHERLRA